MPQGLIHVVINSGQTVSADIDLSKGLLHAIAVPVITSADLMIRGSFDTTSANFRRVQKTLPNTGDLRFATGPGSVMLRVYNDIPAMNYARLEAAVAQTDVRTFTLLVR